jgi:hypothetical protein
LQKKEEEFKSWYIKKPYLKYKTEGRHVGSELVFEVGAEGSGRDGGAVRGRQKEAGQKARRLA